MSSCEKLEKNEEMSVVELSNLLGLSPKTIYRYEKGERTPSATTLITYSVIFDINMEILKKFNNHFLMKTLKI